MGAPPPRSTPRALAYVGARVVEALNLIAWNNRFPADKARSLGWAPVVGYPQILRTIQHDIQARGL